jgi:DNA polymerase III delta prime subunit
MQKQLDEANAIASRAAEDARKAAQVLEAAATGGVSFSTSSSEI